MHHYHCISSGFPPDTPWRATLCLAIPMPTSLSLSFSRLSALPENLWICFQEEVSILSPGAVIKISFPNPDGAPGGPVGIKFVKHRSVLTLVALSNIPRIRTVYVS